MRAKVKAKRITAFALASLLLPACALAQSMPENPPLPPPRPATPDDPPRAPDAPPQRERSPRTTGANPAGAQNGAPAPHIAPDVDRAALRACAIEWRRMKTSGAARGMIWRDFAPDCLTRQTKQRR